MATKKVEEKIGAEELALLDQSYPTQEDGDRLTLPRLGMLSKDIIEETGTGKNKKITVVEAAGTFYTESDLGETNDEGKKVWTREYIKDEEIDVVITFHRKQLRRFDASLEKFISSPFYDTDDQIIPLYLDRQVIKRGTRQQLQSMYPALTQKGKPTSDLKEDIILFVIYKDQLYQLNLSQSSKYEFLNYKKTVNPSTVVTTLGTKEETFGANTYRKLTFKNKELITKSIFEQVKESQTILKNQVQLDAAFMLNSGETTDEEREESLKNF